MPRRLSPDISHAPPLVEPGEGYLRDFLRSAGYLIASVAPDGRLLFVNETWKQLLGYTDQDIANGLSLFSVIAPESRSTVEENFRRILAGESLTDIEAVLLTKDGHRLWVAGESNALFDGATPVAVRGIFRDITRQRVTEAALLESEARYRQMFEGNAAVQMLVDPETGEIVDANPAAVAFYGYPAHELRRLPLAALNELPYTVLGDELTRAVAGELVYVRRKHRIASGELRDVDIYIGLITVRGRRLLHGIIHDVTDRVRAEAEVQLLLDVTHAIGAAPDETEALLVALESMCKAIGWTYGEAWLPTQDPGGAVVLTQGPVWCRPGPELITFAEESRAYRFALGDGVTGKAWATHRPVWLPEIGPESGLVRVALARAAGLRATAAVPVLADDDVVVAVLMFFAAKPSLEDARRIALLGAVAAQTGTAIRRKQTEHALRDSERRIRAIFDTTREFIGLLAPDGTLLAANRAALSFVGRTEQEVLGRPFWETPWWTVTPVLQETLRRAIADAVAGRPARFEATHVGATGELHTVEFSLTPVYDEDGHVVLLVPEGYDVTERNKIARLKSEIIGLASHELRTPISAIRGALDILALDPGPRPEHTQRFLDMAIRNTDRMLRLVNDLLDLERIEAGVARMERIALDAGSVIRQVIDAMASLAEKSGIRIVAGSCDGSVVADADRLMQVLTNLIANAIKFSPAGSAVTVSATVDGGLVRFSVRDEGRGIPAEALERIFGRFEQVAESDAKERQGAGLGLAIAKAIVEQHGGKIWVKSVLGVGSTFFFTIPAVDTP